MSCPSEKETALPEGLIALKIGTKNTALESTFFQLKLRIFDKNDFDFWVVLG